MLKMEPTLLSKINYITSYKRNDKNIKESEEVVRLKLDKISYNWSKNRTNKDVFHIVYDGIPITRKNNYTVSYNCISCDRENIICLNNFIKKIEKGTRFCFTCIVSGNDSLENKILKDKEDFQNLEEKKRLIYEKKLMSPKHFELIRRYILSYNNNNTFCNKDIVYLPYYRPTESNKYYEPCFYNKELNTVSRAINLRFECYHCKNIVKFDTIQPLRKKKYIFCKMCDLQFGPTKYKYESNLLGENVKFKSKMQHKFLKYCNNNNIIIKNGIEDLKNDNMNLAISNAFYLPKLNYYIDVLSNLEYEEYDNSCKRTRVLEEYISSINCKYLIIYPKNYVSLTRKIKHDID